MIRKIKDFLKSTEWWMTNSFMCNFPGGAFERDI